MNPAKLDIPLVRCGETTREFVLWAFQLLGFEPAREGSHYCVKLPEDFECPLTGETEIHFTFDEPVRSRDSIQSAAPGSPLFQWLLAQLGERKLAHAQPAGQPQNVHEFSSRLFDAYQVDGGRIQLAGCTLEDRPILRLTYVEGDDLPSIRHVFVHGDGSPVEKELVEPLGIGSLAPSPGTKIKESQRMVMEHAAQRRAGVTDRRPVFQTVIWCKYAEGKLQIVIGEQTVELSFSAWAQHLADGSVRPPAFRCELTGRSSYHLAATDDGQITTAESIGSCDESGKRSLITELALCHATGKRVLKALLVRCPVADVRVLPAAMKRCEVCRQEVAESALQSGTCAACITVAPVSKNDPRMARVLGEYQSLDRFRKWQLSETADRYILVATALVERVMIVVDKESLEVQRMAVTGRFRTRWTDIQQIRRDELLR